MSLQDNLKKLYGIEKSEEDECFKEEDCNI